MALVSGVKNVHNTGRPETRSHLTGDLRLEAASVPRKNRWLAAAKVLFRLVVLALVAVGIWHTVVKGLAELQARQFSLSHLNPWWLTASGLAYLAGSLPCWLFWHRTLWAMGQRPTRRESLRAFFIGHLGKYVPGKAMVVILRTGLVRSDRVDTTVAVASVFVETLTMMAVGAFVAAAILAVQYYEQGQLLLLAIGLMVCVGGPTVPPIFRRVVRFLGARRFNPEIDRALAGLDYRLMAYGWVTVAAGWAVLGLSLMATLRAMPDARAAGVTFADWPLATACYALALLAGFLSMLPGGLGAREYVLMALLAQPFGEGTALVSAVLVRLMTLAAEAAFAAVLYPLPRGELPAQG